MKIIKNHLEPLGILRGIAALSVVLFHNTVQYQDFFELTFENHYISNSQLN